MTFSMWLATWIVSSLAIGFVMGRFFKGIHDREDQLFPKGESPYGDLCPNCKKRECICCADADPNLIFGGRISETNVADSGHYLRPTRRMRSTNNKPSNTRFK